VASSTKDLIFLERARCPKDVHSSVNLLQNTIRASLDKLKARIGVAARSPKKYGVPCGELIGNPDLAPRD